jgi:hypothetical protein
MLLSGKKKWPEDKTAEVTMHGLGYLPSSKTGKRNSLQLNKPYSVLTEIMWIRIFKVIMRADAGGRAV